MPTKNTYSRCARHVSIHAPRCRGAMPMPTLHCVCMDAFQSTPPVAEGRCKSGAPVLPGHCRFQSTPPVAEGRCGCASMAMTGPINRFNPRPPLPRGDAFGDLGIANALSVSIHAPRCRGAMPSSLSRIIRINCRFNPRPPLPRGDARVKLVVMAFEIVSIHAPRCRGAMRNRDVVCRSAI